MAQVFSCEFAKFLRTPFLHNASGQLLLVLQMLKVSDPYNQPLPNSFPTKMQSNEIIGRNKRKDDFLISST